MHFPDFISDLQHRHESALESQKLVFIPTEVIHLDSRAGVPFEIRYAPSLAKKPVSISSSEVPSHTVDPFAPPYIPELLISQSEDSEGEEGYVVLLNKFCVVPRHFLLVTKEYKSQKTPPTPEDLSAIYVLLQQTLVSDPTFEWLAFYNCGPNSGASQPHKHFQFIPAPAGESKFVELITRSPPGKLGDVYNVKELGYAHFICAIPSSLSSKPKDEETEATLGKFFLNMLDSMIDHLRHLASGQNSPQIRSRELSYNFLMTSKYMMLIPRSRECFLSNGLSINSLGVGAGMVLVKNQAELDEARRLGIDEVLEGVTFPKLKDVINPCDHG
ncbi:HIT-like domain-containing protein [Melampsora americana]|nr:HIT-like domain-containing protein [Melampsora americana]